MNAVRTQSKDPAQSRVSCVRVLQLLCWSVACRNKLSPHLCGYLSFCKCLFYMLRKEFVIWVFVVYFVEISDSQSTHTCTFGKFLLQVCFSSGCKSTRTTFKRSLSETYRLQFLYILLLKEFQSQCSWLVLWKLLKHKCAVISSSHCIWTGSFWCPRNP